MTFIISLFIMPPYFIFHIFTGEIIDFIPVNEKDKIEACSIFQEVCIFNFINYVYEKGCQIKYPYIHNCKLFKSILSIFIK